VVSDAEPYKLSGLGRIGFQMERVPDRRKGRRAVPYCG
jgi:hypothetical protein